MNASRLKILRTIANYRLIRTKHGWRCPGSPLVRAATMQELAAEGLVQVRNYDGRLRPELTATGRELVHGRSANG